MQCTNCNGPTKVSDVWKLQGLTLRKHTCTSCRHTFATAETPHLDTILQRVATAKCDLQSTRELIDVSTLDPDSPEFLEAMEDIEAAGEIDQGPDEA
jgi:hypothetical protein